MNHLKAVGAELEIKVKRCDNSVESLVIDTKTMETQSLGCQILLL